MQNHAARKGPTGREDVKEGLGNRDASASNKRKTKNQKGGMEFPHRFSLNQIPSSMRPLNYVKVSECRKRLRIDRQRKRELENQLDYLFLICDERIQTIRLHR